MRGNDFVKYLNVIQVWLNTRNYLLSDEITCNRLALCWVGRPSSVVLCSCAQPGTELMCCAHLRWPLKDKDWVHREAPTSSGLKEFSDCYISKSDSWKEQHHLKMRLRSVEVHFLSSISSFQEQEMEFISQKFEKKKRTNATLP